jgi:hypothetical protein
LKKTTLLKQNIWFHRITNREYCLIGWPSSVTEVIAAGIGQSAINLLNKKNIQVTSGSPLKSPQG